MSNSRKKMVITLENANSYFSIWDNSIQNLRGIPEARQKALPPEDFAGLQKSLSKLLHQLQQHWQKLNPDDPHLNTHRADRMRSFIEKCKNIDPSPLAQRQQRGHIKVAKKPHKRGRKREYDRKADARLLTAWRTGHYRTYEQLAIEKDIEPIGNLVRALQRARWVERAAKYEGRNLSTIH